MFSIDEVGDIEGDAAAFCNYYGTNCPLELCELATGLPPIFTRMAARGRYFEGRIYLSDSQSLARARMSCAHELSHVHDEHRGWDGPLREERADCFGVSVLMDRREVLAWIRRHGGRHAYSELARDFAVTQSASILRIAEVTGRPVCLLSPRGPITRGQDFGWPSVSGLVRAVVERRPEIHYARISDEPNRHAFMATWDAWIGMCA